MAELSGGPNFLKTFTATSTATWISNVLAALQSANWPLVKAVPATITGAFHPSSSNFVDGGNVTIDGQVYTFRTTINNATPNEVTIGVDLTTSLANLVAAINRASGSGTLYSTPTQQNSRCMASGSDAVSITIVARVGGTSGNGIQVSNSNGPGPWGADWTLVDVDGSTISTGNKMYLGGYQLRATSPQMLTVQVYLYDKGDGSNPTARALFFSDLTPTLKGYSHPIGIKSTGTVFQIATGPTNFFISRPGLNSSGDFFMNGSAIAGGILKVQDPSSVTEAWFSFGDGNNGFGEQSPRTALQTSGAAHTNDGCWNGVLTNNSGNNFGVARILAITSTDAIFFNSGFFAPPLWFDGSDLVYDPQMAWGDSVSTTATVRGTIYDARIQSEQAAMDTTVTDDDQSVWMNYTDQYKWGGLWLLIEQASNRGTSPNLMY